VQPVVFKECDEWKQDDADKERISYIGRDGVASGPRRERPESLERGTDQKADAKLGDPAAGEEDPQGGRTVILRESDFSQKRLNREQNAIAARRAQWIGMSDACHVVLQVSDQYYLGGFKGRFPDVCREQRALCREQPRAAGYSTPQAAWLKEYGASWSSAGLKVCE